MHAQVMPMLTSTIDHKSDCEAYPSKLGNGHSTRKPKHTKEVLVIHIIVWGIVQIAPMKPKLRSLLQVGYADNIGRSDKHSGSYRVCQKSSSVLACINSPKTNTSTIFCLRGILRLVNIGNGRKRIARSVIMLTGADARDRFKMLMHRAPSGWGYWNAESIGRHWIIFRMVNTDPATFTTANISIMANLKNFPVTIVKLK